MGVTHMLTISRDELRRHILDYLSSVKPTVVPDKEVVRVETGTESSERQMEELSARGFIATDKQDTNDSSFLVYEYAFGSDQQGVIERQITHARNTLIATAEASNIPYQIVD